MNTFHCTRCGHDKPLAPDGMGIGYAQRPNGDRVCYVCCGQLDSIDMVATGKATLYLTLPQGAMHNGRVTDQGVDGHKAVAGKVSNWPGTLTFIVLPSGVKHGHHNITGKRYDVWFTGPDGKTWHGVTYGDNTQICHCKRTKAT